MPVRVRVLLPCSVWEVKGSSFPICAACPAAALRLCFELGECSRVETPPRAKLNLSLGPLDSWCHSGKALLGSQGWSPTYTQYQNVLSSVPLEPSKLFSLQFLAFLCCTGSQVITFFCWAGRLWFRCSFYKMHVQFQPPTIFFINNEVVFFFFFSLSVCLFVYF